MGFALLRHGGGANLVGSTYSLANGIQRNVCQISRRESMGMVLIRTGPEREAAGRKSMFDLGGVCTSAPEPSGAHGSSTGGGPDSCPGRRARA